MDTNNPAAERPASDILDAARGLGRKVRILKAAGERDIDAAFTSIVQDRLGALFVAASEGLYTPQDQGRPRMGGGTGRGGGY